MPRSESKLARNIEIYDLRNNGMMFTDIGRRYNITTVRARQIYLNLVRARKNRECEQHDWHYQRYLLQVAYYSKRQSDSQLRLYDEMQHNSHFRLYVVRMMEYAKVIEQSLVALGFGHLEVREIPPAYLSSHLWQSSGENYDSHCRVYVRRNVS